MPPNELKDSYTELGAPHTIQYIAETLAPVFNQYNIKKVFLFGSHAKNIATNNSDIDLLVDSGGTVRGFKLSGLLADIKEAININVDLFEAYGWFLAPFFLLAYTLFYGLRWIVFGFVGWVIKRYDELTFIAQGLRDYLIFAATFTLPLTFITLLSWPSAMNLLFTWCAIVLIIGYLLFLFRTFRYFLYVRFSVFFWILYLCTLEIAPIAFLYSALNTI